MHRVPQWFERLMLRSDWHFAFADEELMFDAARRLHSANPGTTAPYRGLDHLYEAIEALLDAGTVHLGTADPGWDSERQAIDRIVIHHTSRPPGMRASYLNAMHLLRLYVPVYNHPTAADRARVAGQQIASGHVRRSRQVFWGYHWLVRRDGTTQRLLMDWETGWHAGDWATNCRSVAICIDDDLENRMPTGTALEAIARVIRDQYSTVDPTARSLLGHREVNPRRTCPGDLFLSTWKSMLLERLGTR
jgi:hypothetical protein